MADELHFPAIWDRFSAWGSWVEVVDRASGRVLERVNQVDSVAGTVQFERWNEDDGRYEVVMQEREVDLRLSELAPGPAREWFKIPLGDARRRLA